MRAALYRANGPARDVLHVEEVDRPEPGPGQVRVKVVVSAVNPTDYKSRSGATARPIDGWQIPHQDGAGVIDAVGDGVEGSRVGERVWLWFAAGTRWGTAAEWTVVPSEQAVALPDSASFDLGASLGVPAMTAHYCLYADGPIEGGAVLAHGGAGAVGHFAIELAHYGGARVATTVSGPEKAALAAAAGADLVVNYREAGAVEQVKAFAPVMDRIVEVNLPANLELDLAVSGPATTIVTYAATGEDATLPTRPCMTANVKFRFVLLYGVDRAQLVRASRVVGAATAAGALSELPSQRFALESIVEAHEAAEAGAVGKILLDIG